MKNRKHFWQVLFLGFVILFAASAVTVVQPVQVEAAAPKLSKKKASVKEGKTITLAVKNTKQKVTWKSSNSKVVKITKKIGSKATKVTLKGLKKGNATITAKVGKKKLTAKITVKHVHKWRGYATCTQPDTCSKCGATRGTALGHNWAPATCVKVSTCQKCGATQGGLGAHVWDQHEICSVCSTLNMPRLVEMQITNAGVQGLSDGPTVRLLNRGGQQFMLMSKVANLPVPATFTMNGQSRPVYLFDNNSGSFVTSLTGAASCNLHFAIESWNRNDYFSIPFTSSVAFDLWYYNQRTGRLDEYRATVTPTGCSFSKS